MPLSRLVAATVVLGLAWSFGVAAFARGAQGQEDAEADKLLKSAQEALLQKNYPLATTRFREVLIRYAKTPSITPARFWLAVCLIDGHDKNYKEAVDLLDAVAEGAKDVDLPKLVYYRATGNRGLGYHALVLAATNPKDVQKHQQESVDRLTKAAVQFQSARALFEKRAAKKGKWSPDAKELPADIEEAARCTCETAEVLLRLGSYKDAAQTSKIFMPGGDYRGSQHRDLGRYYHGFAAFMLKDSPVAEKTLSMLAPFTDPRFGTHARYLLARLYHLNEERPEAVFHYDGLLNDYVREKKRAQDLLKKPDVLAKDPLLKIRVDNLVRDPPPDHVIRAFFYSGVLLQESGRFAEAKDRFLVFVKAPPDYPVAFEALIRLGICQVQLKEGQAAMKTLQPLVDRDKALSDQVLLWMARAAVLVLPNPNQKALYDRAVARVVELYQQAESRLALLGEGDPAAKHRRGELLLEFADVLMQLSQPALAVKVCGEINQKNLLPTRQEEVAQRLATALHLAGDYDGSDAECERFLKNYPQSNLAPAIQFRYSENSYFRTLAAEKDPKLADKVQALRAVTIQRYQRLIDNHPYFPRAQNARFVIGQLLYNQGEFAKAQAIFEVIPPNDRTGDLAVVSYLLADCLLRQAPAGVPEDALAAGKLEVLLKSSIELLDAFVSAQPTGPQTPVALMRMGQTMQRLATLQAQPAERNKLYTAARAVFERILQPQFAKHPLQPQALLERARCRVGYSGDINKSSTELRQFLVDPLRQTPVAPLAVVQLTTWMRGQNRHAEAATIIATFTTDYAKRKGAEPQMLGLLAYHRGLALQGAGQLVPAREAFQDALKLVPDQPEGYEAAWRSALCRKDQSTPLLQQAKNLLESANPKDQQKGQQLLNEALEMRREAVLHLDKHVDRLKDKQPLPDAVGRMLFEAAWFYRDLADHEVQAARAKVIEAWQKKLGAKATKVVPLEVSLTQLPMQPSETKARARYLTLIELLPELPLTQDARLELAEYLALRNEHDEAIKLLNEALDREPLPELTEKVRFLLGICHAAKGNTKAALTQFDVVGQVPKSHLAAQAKYRAGEVLMQNKQYAEAIKRLSIFRDVPQFQELFGLSDRAVLRIGHAYIHLQQWEAARQAFDYLAKRYPGSKWSHDARFGLGWAHEQLKQFEPAASAYSQAAANAGFAEVGAKAQVRLGLCRVRQERYKDAADAFLVVPGKYGYDEWNTVALLEAADAYVLLSQTDQARAVLQRLIKEYPETSAAKTAKERLSKL
jgi:TolA-binding protein